MSNMTVIETLDAMLALYAKPGTWTQAGVAQDAAGREVPATNAEAVAWSLEGALYRVIGDPDEAGITEDEWRRRSDLVGGVLAASTVDLMAFNDAARRQDVVVAVLRAGLTLDANRNALTAVAVAQHGLSTCSCAYFLP